MLFDRQAKSATRPNAKPARHPRVVTAARTAAGACIEALEGRMLLSVSAMVKPGFVLAGGTVTKDSSTSVVGFTAAKIRKAYGIDSVSFNGVVGDGSGQTIAIVDAYDDTTIADDLAAFSTAEGLSAASLTIVKQAGTGEDPAGPGDSWSEETSLDVEWAHAVAPGANILLLEAKSANSANLDAMVDVARTTSGVSVISMSWGSTESSSSATGDTHFVTPSGHQGITFVASSGDNGSYNSGVSGTMNVNSPAVSKNVVGVGGTSLTTTAAGLYTSEGGWGNSTSSYSKGGSGGGISQYVTRPTYQSTITLGSGFRTVPDVSFLANPNTGVGVYDSYDSPTAPWLQIGGTSLSAPMFAGVMAIVNQGRVLNGLTTLDGPTQTLPMLYALSSADYHDITTGNNGYAAGTGYDLVTGLGTPIVNKFALDMAGYSSTATAPIIGSFTDSPASTTIGASVLLSATATDTNGTISTVKFYADTDGTAGLNTATDTLLGSGAASGSNYSLSISTSSLPAGTTTLYAVATDSGNVTTNKTATLTLTNPVYPPTIGLFNVYPTSVTVGSNVSLLANASETNGTITGVTFYADTDGTAGLNTSTDKLLGSGAVGPAGWTLLASTSGLSAGTVTLYAVATDANNVTASKSASLILTNPVSAPSVTSFTVNPKSTTVGASVLFTAAASESNGTISGVSFYLESNSVGNVQPGSDTFLGAGTLSGGTWSASISTTSIAAGTYTVYAVATDATSQTASASAALVLTNPVFAPSVTSFTANPNATTIGGSVLLSAAASETNGTIASVQFFADTDGTAGLNTATDTLLGTGAASGGVWTMSVSTSAFSAGSKTLFAVATDTTSQTAQASTTLTLTAAVSPPVIGSFTANPASTTIGGSVLLTATASETNGTIASISFYRESNGTGGLQTGGDTLLGTGSGGSYSISASTAGLSAGTYTVYAIATDSLGATTSTSTTFALTTAGATTLPTAPSSISAVANSGSQITVSWTDASSNESGFEIQRSASSTFSSPTTFTAAANATSYADTTVTKSTYYYYRVRAVNSIGNSAYTKSIKIKSLATAGSTGGGGGTTGTLLGTPTSLAGKAVTGPAVALTWTDTASGETGYEIEVSTASNFSTIFKDITVSTPNLAAYTVTGLAAKGYYYFRVRAISATPSLDSAWSSSVKIKTLAT